MTNHQRDTRTDGMSDHEPLYVISIAARILGVHQQTLRYYERAGLIEPKRSPGNMRMYSSADIDRVRQAQRLIDELGLNLAGADIVMRMKHQIEQLQIEVNTLRAELNQLRGTRLPAPRRHQPGH
ncbi:MAG TPA: MerR family transcriptional regulator [Longimicrobiaceae bacterium]|nr:MerR family transcriptional regulator [Longimicrobiaceae bacterium]